MRLVIFGLSVSSAWGNGHATLWRGLIRALSGMGHEVYFFEKDVPYYAAHRDYTEIPRGRLILYDNFAAIRAQAERLLRDADVGMVTSYCPDGLAATDLVISSSVPVKSFYDLDAPITLERLRAGQPVDYIGPRGLRDFDIVLSYTGGGTLEELRTRLHAEYAVPLYGSVDPEVHRPAAAVPYYQADLSYLGTYAEDRQQALEELFIAPARRLPDQKFLIGGAQYPPHFPWTSNIYFVRHVPPPEHPAFFGSSRLTLNVTRSAMAAAGFCPSGRLFEAAACGAPVLSDWWEGLDEFFAPGEEVLIARTADDSMNALSRSEEELRRIAARARERALTCHTARRRAEELVQYLEQECAPAGDGRTESCGASFPPLV
jgi:spore maturation protein CgeB